MMGATRVPQVTAQQAHDLHRRGHAVILDVREGFERRQACIPGTVHIPMQDVSARLTELPRDTRLIVQCHSGNRSSLVCGLLQQHGFEHVANLEGGILAWHRAGLPLEGA